MGGKWEDLGCWICLRPAAKEDEEEDRKKEKRGYHQAVVY
jgi:mannose-1-phosphate guanylyltransferase